MQLLLFTDHRQTSLAACGARVLKSRSSGVLTDLRVWGLNSLDCRSKYLNIHWRHKQFPKVAGVWKGKLCSLVPSYYPPCFPGLRVKLNKKRACSMRLNSHVLAGEYQPIIGLKNLSGSNRAPELSILSIELSRYLNSLLGREFELSTVS